jgi:hypothetical protein
LPAQGLAAPAGVVRILIGIRQVKTKFLATAFAAAFLLQGCVGVALTAAGVGMATSVSHTLSGMVYKTFTAPQANVKRATVGALGRMQIKLVHEKREGTTDTLEAKAADRDIEIELEALTPATTRMMVTAKKDGGFLRDGATATEIILQTEKMLGT